MLSENYTLINAKYFSLDETLNRIIYELTYIDN